VSSLVYKVATINSKIWVSNNDRCNVLFKGKWNPNEFQLTDILKTAVLNLEVAILVCCLFCFFFKFYYKIVTKWLTFKCEMSTTENSNIVKNTGNESSQMQLYVFDGYCLIWNLKLNVSVRPSMPFSTDTDTPIFCCQPIPIRYQYASRAAVAQRDWQIKGSLITAVEASAAADAFDLWWTVKHSNYQ